MDNSGLAPNWLRSIGKEKVQSFQDNFSGMYDISLCLLSLSGDPLTVWSSESLFCHYMRSHNLARCQMQRQQMLKKMCGKGSTVLDTCYMGIASFICPVFLSGRPIAAFWGGAVDTGGCRVLVDEDYFINSMSGERLREISKFLDSIIAMLSPDSQLTEIDSSGQQLRSRFNLTPREFTVVEQLMTGKSNKQVGAPSLSARRLSRAI